MLKCCTVLCTWLITYCRKTRKKQAKIHSHNSASIKMPAHTTINVSNSSRPAQETFLAFCWYIRPTFLCRCADLQNNYSYLYKVHIMDRAKTRSQHSRMFQTQKIAIMLQDLAKIVQNGRSIFFSTNSALFRLHRLLFHITLLNITTRAITQVT